MKTGFLITARMKSTRLPMKLVQEINGRQVIRHMLDRIKTVQELQSIIICTSTNPQDDLLVDIATQEGVKYFRGSEEDVIGRLYEAAKSFELDYVVNITADCPLVAPEYIRAVIDRYCKGKADFIRCLDLPHGLFSYGMDIEAMSKVVQIKDSACTEVWGRYFTDTGLFRVEDLEIPLAFQRKYRLTLDYPEDLEVLRTIFAYFKNGTYKVGISELIAYLDKNPDIVSINRECAEQYRLRYQQQDSIKLKQ